MLNIELITRRRIALRLSRHDVARETGLSWQALLELEESDWRDGRHTLNTLYAVAWALGLNPSDLLRSGPPAPRGLRREDHRLDDQTLHAIARTTRPLSRDHFRLLLQILRRTDRKTAGSASPGRT